MFTGSRLKIERAKKHISDLQNEILSFSKPNFYTLTVEKHPETGNDTPKLRITKPSPEGLTLVIGDAIHNLHTALDLAVCEVVRDKLGATAVTRYVKFPFDNTSRENFISYFGKGKIAKACPAIFDLILDIEPYKGGNDTLIALHDLDILDKHELLIPLIEFSAIIGISAKDDAGGQIKNWNVILPPKTEWLQTNLSGNVQINDHGQTFFIICFAKESPIMSGRVVLPTLIEFAKLVTSIIDAFEIALS
jgi:hypothetical protein